MQQRPKVYLQRCDKYSIERLKQFLDTCFASDTSHSFRSAKVLIKPNLITARRYGPATTDPRFILALGEWFVDSGAAVYIGDSPAFGSAAGVLEALSVKKELIKRGISIVEFSQGQKVDLPCGVNVTIASSVFENDYFINAPKVKAHNQVYVTLAVKNIFGIVKGLQKSMLHMRHGGTDNVFVKIIVDLIDILPKNYSVVDGIEVMHRQGPVHGDPLNLGCVAFSDNPIALDSALISLLQLEHRKSPLWREAEKRGCRGNEVDALEYPLLSPESFHGSGFQPPAQLSPIRFNPFRFVAGNIKRLLHPLFVSR